MTTLQRLKLNTLNRLGSNHSGLRWAKALFCQGCKHKRSSTIWLSEAAALQEQGINKPVRMLLIGGAYMMLLANAPRTTDDVDIFWVEEGADFRKARQALRDAVQAIASRDALPPNWFNYLTR